MGIIITFKIIKRTMKDLLKYSSFSRGQECHKTKAERNYNNVLLQMQGSCFFSGHRLGENPDKEIVNNVLFARSNSMCMYNAANSCFLEDAQALRSAMNQIILHILNRELYSLKVMTSTHQ